MLNFQQKQEAVNFRNGFGEYDSKNNEYVIYTSANKPTPRPWVNIITNPNFGTLITEAGAGFTWYKNSYLYRITPWVNNSISQKSGEILYLKDEISGEVWSPTPLPSSAEINYRVRHGHGYSIFENDSHNLNQELKIFVHKDLPIKFFELTFKNTSSSTRKISATLYIEWLLGDLMEKTRFHIEQEILRDEKMIVANNPFLEDFTETFSYMGSLEKNIFYCTDRTKFWGRNNSSVFPEMLKEPSLTVGKNEPNDCCGAIQAIVEIPALSERKVVFYLGADETKNLSEISKTASDYAKYFKDSTDKWQSLMKRNEICTPNIALNTLWNNRLIYQLLSSRLWGRVSFYQPGGAYGFRDQLQDVMALSWISPEITREHILLAASKQFRDGSVQHWWHPPTSKGIKSESSDAHLWLVYVTEYYIKITGDRTILEENVSYLEENKQGPDNYYAPQTGTGETLYQHLLKAIELTLGRMGDHNLPLILKGDWNDALNMVGIEGKGESVWLGFFLAKILEDFHFLVDAEKDNVQIERYRNIASDLARALDEVGWDGEWYLRAYWDNGEKLGSHKNLESRIDSLPQSWSVISGVGIKDKTIKAISSVENELIDHESKLTLMLTPPFKKTKPAPGYIALYPPGVRENGGAYTHAALWVAQAEAMLGNADMAMEILDMINPLLRTKTQGEALLYEAEPYVLASDIYSSKSNAGRAGWTWYTGSASLYYIVVLENILGIQKRDNKLFLNPCIPKKWREFSLKITNKSSIYSLSFVNPDGVSQGVSTIMVDGQKVNDFEKGILLEDDGKSHTIEVKLGGSLTNS